MPHKILVAQGGGPTAVINQSLAGVALEAVAATPGRRATSRIAFGIFIERRIVSEWPLLCNLRRQPKTGFSRFPPVHQARLGGQQRVDLTHSAHPRAMTGSCAKRTSARQSCWSAFVRNRST